MIKRQISSIAIDDEPIALDILKAHAKSVAFLELRACFVSVREALHYLSETPVDLVFLDINMPDQSGLEIARQLHPDTKFVFTTAYADYAVEGFELAASDYLLKPIKAERFVLACERVLAQMGIKAEAQQHIFIKSGYELLRIALRELLFIRSADNYIVIYEGDKQHVSRMTMTEIMELLPANDFIRVHKSYIVSIAHIQRIEGQKLFISKHEIPVSKTYKTALDRIKK